MNVHSSGIRSSSDHRPGSEKKDLARSDIILLEVVLDALPGEIDDRAHWESPDLGGLVMCHRDRRQQSGTPTH